MSDQNKLFLVISILSMALVFLCVAVVASGGDGTFVKPTIRDGGPIKTQSLGNTSNQIPANALLDCPANSTYRWIDGKLQCEPPPTTRLSSDPPLPPAKIKCTRPADRARNSLYSGPEIINCEFNEQKFIIEIVTK